MKALIVLTTLLTFTLIALHYLKRKNLKKTVILLGSFIALLGLIVAGGITRQVTLLFLLHIVLVIVAWGGIIWYLIKDRYYWWVIFSPVITVGLFLLLELLTGSGHEVSPLG